MLFPTVEFAVFMVVVFPLSWLLRRSWFGWRWFMLGASLFFYGWWDAGYVILLAISIVANHHLGDAIAASRDAGSEPVPGSSGPTTYPAAVTSAGPPASEPLAISRLVTTRRLVGLGVAVNLLVLGAYKYYGFFVTSLVNALDDVGIGVSAPLLEVVLPVGISFFTFQAISYLIDISRGEIAPMAFLDFAVYLSFFPQLVAGPIVRASEMAPQLDRPPDPRRVESAEAFRLVLVGLFKKVVVASFLAEAIVDPVFAVPAERSALEVLVAIYAYAVQIYADFSGYTDIAIGCALLLGFRFPKNFDAPYVASSLQDFWRRWHMTLSRWLRDYLYISLGGNRGGRLLTYRNLFLTMLLGGLWHGAAWTFVVWGALHGGWLAAERWLNETGALARLGLSRTAARWIGWFVTFHVVCLGWVFFRADGLDTAVELLSRLTAWGAAPLVTPLVVLVVAGAIAAQFVPERAVLIVQDAVAERSWLAQGALVGVALVLIDALGPEGVAPFIYFQF